MQTVALSHSLSTCEWYLRRELHNPMSVTAAPLLAKFLHVRRSELDRTLQVAGFAILLGWAMYTAFNATQAIFLNKAGPHAYPLFFVVLALAVWPMVALQGALTRRLGVGRTLRLTLVLNAGSRRSSTSSTSSPKRPPSRSPYTSSTPSPSS